jgi:hypothetical protein
LDLLQPLEIPQNRQDILWKSLAENRTYLERLGKSLEAARPCPADPEAPGHDGADRFDYFASSPNLTKSHWRLALAWPTFLPIIRLLTRESCVDSLSGATESRLGGEMKLAIRHVTVCANDG